MSYFYAQFEEDRGVNHQSVLAVYLTLPPTDESVAGALADYVEGTGVSAPTGQAPWWEEEATPVSERAGLHRVVVYGCYRR